MSYRNLRNIRYKPLISYNESESNYILIQQFHIPKDKARLTEIQDTLRKNSNNKHFKQIYLLNERHYTAVELGFENGSIPSVIHQIDIGKRLTYRIAFLFVQKFIKDTWCILSNNDIYYDDSITQIPSIIKRTYPSQKINFICLQRYEIGPNNSTYLSDTKAIGIPNGCLQDSWIFYSNESPITTMDTSITLGVPGCDNRIAYVLKFQQNYNLINIPSKIKSYHNHSTGIRYYSKNSGHIKGPYFFIPPL